MEFWSIIMELSMHWGKINPIKRGKLEVSHLLFADDILFFCEGDEKSAKGLTELLEQFRLNTGLVINKNKSKAFFSKGCRDHGYIGHSSWEFPHKILWASTVNHIPKNREFLSFAWCYKSQSRRVAAEYIIICRQGGIDKISTSQSVSLLDVLIKTSCFNYKRIGEDLREICMEW